MTAPGLTGMVLAAGAGRRLRPDTDVLPKALIPIDGDTTILDIALANLASVGIEDVVVVVGHAAEAVESRQILLERRHGVRLTLVHNDRAEEWNNAYSMWTARDHLRGGVLMLNGDTVHPVSVEKTLLSQRGPGVLLAVDRFKRLGDEEMKVRTDTDGAVTRITKLLEPADAHGEYIGATVVEAEAADQLIDALERTWRRDTALYYEDAYQDMVDSGAVVMTACIPPGTLWVEVDNHADLATAKEIAWQY